MRCRTLGEEETEALGEALGRSLQAGDVVALYGDLGSGKTTLVRGVCRGLGASEPVSSPTFVLLNVYHGRLPIYHFDAYRLTGSEELWEIGAEELFYGEGVCLVEWAERAADLLPPRRLEVRLNFVAGEPRARDIEIVPLGRTLELQTS
ncbi:MAG TPA: tRNA (adenosine(37)-N6)-threonylcarbamoyltransferase complex ATPase subunit type 1 TsaE [Candidatus Nitrosotenuis sp.]|jgi:tRNA threonylcarbamoyladenosine biosynthesis protein TsaE|nr:tRNA (adenosine(37)-N6)-threonylcarbamoyltransferase complex ATPase subunit type 1 TsaE [Candidatus Nitrosotenuis sp.]